MLDTVRVSQIRSITFASGDMQRYHGQLGCNGPLEVNSDSTDAPRTNSFGTGDGNTPLPGIHDHFLGNGNASSTCSQDTTRRLSDHSFEVPLAANQTDVFSPTDGGVQQARIGSASDLVAIPHDFASLSQPQSDFTPSLTVNTHARSTVRVTDPGTASSTINHNNPSTLDQSFGPAVPTLAFAPEDQLLSKYAVLLQTFLFACQERSEGSCVDARRSFFSQIRSQMVSTLQQCSGYREWREQCLARSESESNERSVVVVQVTPRQLMEQQRAAPKPLLNSRPSQSLTGDSAESTSVVSATEDAVSPTAAQAAGTQKSVPHTLTSSQQQPAHKAPLFDEEAFFLWNDLSQVLGVLLRDCVADFAKLLHLVINLSPQKMAEQAVVCSVLGRKRQSNMGQVSGVGRPALHGNVPHLAGLSRPGDVSDAAATSDCHPKFLLACTLTDAFLALFMKEVVTLLTVVSSESAAREQIAFRNLCDRWQSVRDALRHGSAVIVTSKDSSGRHSARPSRTVLGAASGASAALNALDELLQLGHEWVRCATAPKQHPLPAPAGSRRSSNSAGQVSEYRFAIHFAGCLELSPCGETHLFRLFGAGSALPAGGADSSARYATAPDAKVTTAAVTGKTCGALRKPEIIVVAAALLFTSVACAAFGFSGTVGTTGGGAAVAAIALALAFVAFGAMLLNQRAVDSDRRARSIERWLCCMLATVSTDSLAALEFTAALPTASGPSPQLSFPTANSALGSTYAVSTPSPYPSQAASLIDGQLAVTGNQTPLGLPLSPPPVAVTANKSQTKANFNSSNSGVLAATSQSLASKKPNPLTVDAFQPDTTGNMFDATDAFDSPDVVRVRMDPTGTFLIPFLEKEPILLDGVHIHKHLAIIGVEFTRPLCDESSVYKSTLTNSDSEMLGDDIQDEDRYCVCMWNMAMAEASGGYTADQIVDQTLAQIIADADSYTTVMHVMRQCEDAYSHHSIGAFDCEPFVIRVVHKELGKFSMRMTLSPVLRYEEDQADPQQPVCIGALLTGVPVDAPGQLRAFNYRNLYLSEVLEECVACMSCLQLKSGGLQTMSNIGTAHPTPKATSMVLSPFLAASPPQGEGATSGGQMSFQRSPNLPSLVPLASQSRIHDFRRVNAHFLQTTISDLSSVASFSDQSWRALYTNFIPGMLSKSFAHYSVRVRVEPIVPTIVEVNISAITLILDQILNTNPSVTASSAGGAQLNMSTRSNQSVTSQAAAPLPPVGVDTQIRVSFGLLQEDSVVMYCKIENISLDRYADMLCREIEAEESSGVPGAPTSALGLIRSAEARVLFLAGDSDSAAGAQQSPEDQVLRPVGRNSSLILQDAQLRRFRSSQQLATTNLSHGAGSFNIHKDVVAIYFPYRAQTAANTAISVWETREKKSTVHDATSGSTSPSTTPTGSVARTDAPFATGGTAAGGTTDDVLSVMVDANSDLDRQKYTRRFWEDHHSVFPIDAGKFFTRGLKLLRSQCRVFDAVVLDYPKQMPEDEFEKKIEAIAKEFSQTTFVLLRPKKKRRKSILPLPLHPTTSFHIEKKTSALISFVTVQEQKPQNFHIIPKVGTQQGIDELVQYVSKQAKIVKEEFSRKQHLQQLFREHRTSPWTRGKKLGKGTFGDVYEACLSLTGGKMAVKIIRLPSSEPERMAQLINEIEILANVKHQNIVQYFYCEAGQSAGEVNIFMELCTGGSLHSKSQSLRPPDITQVSSWIQQLCSALAYLHRNHLAHRDIKPHNILLSESNAVKLADFGTAVAVSAPIQEVAGTFTYMAPEVYAGSDYGTPCDVWSVGCVLLDLLGKDVCHKIVGSGGGGFGGGYFSECTTDEEIWSRFEAHITDTVLIDFLRGCFRLDPLSRNTAEQLLMHPFLANRARLSSPAPVLPTKRSAPNLFSRKSQESSVGALSVDSGEFARQSSSAAPGADPWGDDSSDDDQWKDVVRGGDDSDTDGAFDRPPPPHDRRPTRAPALLDIDVAAANAFTPKVHNSPTPTSRSKSFVAESPASRKRRLQKSPDDHPGESASPAFSTNAAAMARRQSMKAALSINSSTSEQSRSSGEASGMKVL